MNNKHILIVDDDLDILAFVQAMLEDEGYQVTTSDKGEYVERLSPENLPDLLLLDVLISGKDGREIARKLRAQEATRNLPIIMLSAHPNAEKTVQECGANDFLSKPFDLEDLLTLVEKYV